MIDHLVIIAGPSSAGKSTLARRIGKNECPELNARLGLHDLSEMPTMSFGALRAMTSKALQDVYNMDSVILQYNITRNRDRPGDYDHPVFSQANKISVITLWTPPGRLFRYRLNRLWINYRRRGHKSTAWLLDAPLKTFSYHARPRRILQNYQDWYAFCEQWSDREQEHLIIEYQDSIRFLTKEQWDSEARAYRWKATSSCVSSS